MVDLGYHSRRLVATAAAAAAAAAVNEHEHVFLFLLDAGRGGWNIIISVFMHYLSTGRYPN